MTHLSILKYLISILFIIYNLHSSYSEQKTVIVMIVMRNIFIVHSLPPLSPDDTPTLIFIAEAQHPKSIEVSAL